MNVGQVAPQAPGARRRPPGLAMWIAEQAKRTVRRHPTVVGGSIGLVAMLNPLLGLFLRSRGAPADPASLAQIAERITRRRPQPGAGASSLVAAVLRAPTGRNAVTFHVSPDESRRALLGAIRGAERSFFIQTFIWHDDAAGHEILGALAARKREVEARGRTFDAKVLIDGFGLREGSGGYDDTKVVAALQEAGIEVRVKDPTYHSPEIGEAVPYAYNHAKLYIQDGRLFLSGGRNIGREYLMPTYQLPGAAEPEISWHDLLFTIRGEETGRALADFALGWRRAGGTFRGPLPPAVPAPDGRALAQSFMTDPLSDRFGLWEAHATAIAHARREIVAIYPYFSDDQLIDALIRAKAARPGLSIKVLMPGVKEESKEGEAYWKLNGITASRLLAAGIEVRFLSTREVDGAPVRLFSHMKALLIDDELLSLGSANGDARSYNGNHEFNTIMADAATIADFRQRVVDPDWRGAEPANPEALAPTGFVDTWRRAFLYAIDGLL